MMRSKPVDSSVLIAVGYDEANRILKAHFRNGRTYYYLAVPPEVYQSLLTAPSLGKYLNEAIKPKYRAVKEEKLKALRKKR